MSFVWSLITASVGTGALPVNWFIAPFRCRCFDGVAEPIPTSGFTSSSRSTLRVLSSSRTTLRCRERPAVRPLPASFETWLQSSSDDEVVSLLRLVIEAAERRGFAPAVTWSGPLRATPRTRLRGWELALERQSPRSTGEARPRTAVTPTCSSAAGACCIKRQRELPLPANWAGRACTRSRQSAANSTSNLTLRPPVMRWHAACTDAATSAGP